MPSSSSTIRMRSLISCRGNQFPLRTPSHAGGTSSPSGPPPCGRRLGVGFEQLIRPGKAGPTRDVCRGNQGSPSGPPPCGRRFGVCFEQLNRPGKAGPTRYVLNWRSCHVRAYPLRLLLVIRSLELYYLAGIQEDYVLCHVHHPVAYSLQVVGDVDQRDRPQCVLRVGAAAHVLDQVVEDPVVQAVDLAVLCGHFPGAFSVFLDQGVEDVADLLARELTHQPELRPKRSVGEPAQSGGATGDAHRVVTDPLQLDRDVLHPHQTAQVAGHRLLGCDDLKDLLTYLPEQLVDRLIVHAHPVGPGAVEGAEGGEGIVDLGLDQTRHTKQRLAQKLQLSRESLPHTLHVRARTDGCR